MKKKIFLTAAIAAVMALSFAGCGVKVTDMAIPETATIEKGESVTLPINFGTEKAPAETPVLVTGDAATAETADTDEKLAAAAEKLTIEWTSSNEDVATVDENGMVTAVGAGEADITAAVKQWRLPIDFEAACCADMDRIEAQNIFIRGEQTWKKTEFDQSNPAEPSV